MKACNCNASLNNTGLPTCQPIINVIKRVILVPLFDNSGAANAVSLSATFNQAFFDALINQTDGSKRWYPLPEMKNVTSPKADTIYQTFDDGSKIFIREGIRSFTGIIPKQSTNYLDKLKSARCREFGVYLVDKDGNLIGTISADGTQLLPIQVDNASWNPIYGFGTDTTVSQVVVGFDFNIDMADEDLRMITAADITPVNLSLLRGLLDLHAVYSAISTTGFTAKINTDFGSVLNPIVAKGLLTTNFTLQNLTTPAAVPILTFTDNQDGTYAFTYAAQASGDELELTGNKSGYDFSDVNDDMILIP